mmetsp:Transcript_10230/g.14088  ORF Transcript_10230/g.14088 Transcript_10230/m.14088 type:complete len:137 (-) Transcript_10230:416-826(-)
MPGMIVVNMSSYKSWTLKLSVRSSYLNTCEHIQMTTLHNVKVKYQIKGFIAFINFTVQTQSISPIPYFSRMHPYHFQLITLRQRQNMYCLAHEFDWVEVICNNASPHIRVNRVFALIIICNFLFKSFVVKRPVTLR